MILSAVILTKLIDLLNDEPPFPPVFLYQRSSLNGLPKKSQLIALIYTDKGDISGYRVFLAAETHLNNKRC
jgi:hypothetical protein